MKRLKTSLLRSLFLLVAIQVLNLSIDVDYLAFNSPCVVSAADYDDIDSFAELLIEKMTGNDHFTSENDDDSGTPYERATGKFDTCPFYAESIKSDPLNHFIHNPSTWTTGLDLSNRTCKGYFNISSPPPEA